jgi:hypothetical protein
LALQSVGSSGLVTGWSYHCGVNDGGGAGKATGIF